MASVPLSSAARIGARSVSSGVGTGFEPVRGTPAKCIEFEAYFSQYTVVANVVVDYWMRALSGSEFKVLLLFIRDTVGQEAKRKARCLQSELTIDQIRERTGLNRESVILAVKALESSGGGLIIVERCHRKTNKYRLNVSAVLAARVEKSDSTKIGKSDLNTPSASENPTQNLGFESENPTPYKEIKKAAAAASSLGPAGRSTIGAEDWKELRAIEQHAGVFIDGKNAKFLKTAAEGAGLTLGHLRWLVQKESFSAARSPLAVLLTLARELGERAEGIDWPSTLSLPRHPEVRGFSAKEISESL